MLVDFKELPDTARVWVYQSDRKFTEEERDILKGELDKFLTSWTAHGHSLMAGYDIPYDRFIIIGLDQTHASASGCSIDASVHFIQVMEKLLGVTLLDNMNVTFRQGDHIQYKALKDFRKMAKDRAVSANTIVFNNLVTDKQEYANHWEVPASESWHARFMKK